MVYRATDDGFGAQNFHDKCNGISNTLVVIKSTTGYIFGGYTNAQWSSHNKYGVDPEAFLFSLTNYINQAKKIKCTQPEYAIYNYSGYGPTFGGRHNLLIIDNSNLNSLSFHNLSDFSYIVSDYPNLFNAGHGHFQVSQIEIYCKDTEII